jgi:hypothetical protein
MRIILEIFANKTPNGLPLKYILHQWKTCVRIDGAPSRVAKRRHDVTFPLLTYRRGKDCVHFSTGFIQKKTLSTSVLQIFHTKNQCDDA